MRNTWIIVQEIMDIVFGIVMLGLAYTMIFEGLFDWVTIGIEAFMLFVLMFLNNEIAHEINKKEES